MRATDDRCGKILVVDDHELFRFSIRRLLLVARPNWLVLTAPTAAEAIELAGVHHPPICLLDFQMPEMSGLEAIPFLRVRSPETSIVLMSVAASIALADRAQAAGAAGLIDKVTLGDDLEAALACILGGVFFRSATAR